jgi:hypothetical protein
MYVFFAEQARETEVVRVFQTNFLVITRMVGTMVGSGVAIGAQYAFWQDPVVLPIIGFAFSLPCFWLIVSQPPYASTGRFLLLSYNLVCVYSFNVRDKNVHILITAYNRIVVSPLSSSNCLSFSP